MGWAWQLLPSIQGNHLYNVPFFALVANHLADVFLGFRIWAVLSIVMVMVIMSISLPVSIASFGSTIAIRMFEVTPFIMVIPLFVAMIHLRSMASLE